MLRAAKQAGVCTATHHNTMQYNAVQRKAATARVMIDKILLFIYLPAAGIFTIYRGRKFYYLLFTIYSTCCAFHLYSIRLMQKGSIRNLCHHLHVIC